MTHYRWTICALLFFATTINYIDRQMIGVLKPTLEKELGWTRAKALFDVAEEAKAHLLEFATTNAIDIDFRPGQMSVVHKKRYLKDYQAHPALMAERFGYPHITYMDADETARRLGSTHYLGGIRDTGTGHIHPLKLVVGTARVAAAAGAHLHENTPATKMESSNGKVRITTPRGTITAAKALIAVNAYGGNLEEKSAAHIMPIGSFIGATVPLGDDSPVLPGGESVDDSRFVVRYFRKSADGRLLFGGREIYSTGDPKGIADHIRRQITEVYPALKDVEITHQWGGYVGITMPRKPYVREVMPNVISAGGYSGHGVAMATIASGLAPTYLRAICAAVPVLPCALWYSNLRFLPASKPAAFSSSRTPSRTASTTSSSRPPVSRNTSPRSATTLSAVAPGWQQRCAGQRPITRANACG